MTQPDPYRHHPELKGQIKPAAESVFRTLDLDAIDARSIAQGRDPNWRTPCEDREAGRRAWLNGRMDQDLWVFGYGSLMWDPALVFSEVRRARVQGFGRSFCLWDEGGRGTVEQPGLMLALDTGEGCEGLVFRVAAADVDAESFILFRREMIADAYKPAWLTLQTAQGPVEALGFVANHGHDRIRPGIPLDRQARMLAVAEGELGTGFDYLTSTQAHLAHMGIDDAYISDLYRRTVALR